MFHVAARGNRSANKAKVAYDRGEARGFILGNRDQQHERREVNIIDQAGFEYGAAAPPHILSARPTTSLIHSPFAAATEIDPLR